MKKLFKKISFNISKFTKVDPKSLLKKKKRLYFGLGIIATLMVAISLTLFFSFKDTGAAWWNDNWMYRKLVPVTNNITEESNVYIAVTIDTSDTDKFQGDCGDLRFTKYNGELLPYYIVSGCGTASTSIHVDFNTFPAGSQGLYYYYGNPSAANGFESSDFSTEATDYTVGSFGSEEATPGPAAYWKFDEGYGTTTKDSTQNANTGTIAGSTLSWQSEDKCLNGKCLHFDGNTGYIDAGNNSALNPTEEVTVSMWVKNQRATGKHTFLARKTSGTGGYGIYQSNTETISFFVYYGSGTPSYQFCTASDYTLPQNQWTHISGQFKQDDYLKVYINGVEKGSCSPIYSSAIGTSGNNFLIGYQGWWGTDNAYFKGFMDDVKVYDYTRSAEEIKTDYLGSAQVLGLKDESFLSDGLIGYWKMDESASPAIDSSGRGYSATWYGDAAASSGKYGNGIVQADTGGGYLGVSDTGDPFDMGTSDFSVSMWFKLDSLSAPNAPELLDKMVSAATGYHLRVAYSDEVEFQVKGAGGNIEVNSANSAIQTDRWYHVVAVYDKKNGHKIYLDGAQSGNTVTGDAGNIDNTDALRIGMGFNSWEMDGTYDETRIYNRALTPQEIRDLYNWAPSPIAYYNFDEGTGTSANDTSGNGNTGTLTNSPTWDIGKFGGGIKLTTANKYVDVPTIAPNITNDSLTIEGWVNISLGGVQRIFIERSQGYPQIGVTGTAMFVHTKTSSGTDTNLPYTTLPSNCQSGWHHIAVTWNTSLSSNNVKAYCDGVNFTNATLVNAINGTFSFTGLKIGYNADTQSVNGTIDDVRVYNYARTPGQIVENMNAEHPAPGSPIGSTAGYWKFDDGYGTTIKDSGPNSSHGTSFVGTPTWTNSGKFAKALNFNGSDAAGDYAVIPYSSNLNIFANTNWTVSAWVKPVSGGPSSYTIIQGTSHKPRILVSTTTATFQGFVGEVFKTLVTANGITADQWNHVVFLADGTYNKIYINGIEKGSAAYQQLDSPFTELRIGASGWSSENFWGDIDEIKFYSFALTQNQILLDMNQGVSQVFGYTSTDSSGNPDNSSDREYCVPGDATSCSAPVAEWKMDEKTGQSINDTSVNNTIGTLGSSGGTDTNDPAWTSAKFGGGLNFDGSNDYVDLGITPSALSFITGRPNVSFSAWIKPDLINNYDGVICNSTGGGTTDQRFCLTLQTTNRIRFLVGNSTSYQSIYSATDSLIPNQWQHIAVTMDSSNNVRIYVNGQLSNGNQTLTVDLETSSVSWKIGAAFNAPTSYQFDGAMDNLKIYNYTLTPAQIAWDYNRGGPEGWWKFDECQGGTANDSSGNGNSGTITPVAGTYTSVGTCNGSASTQMWAAGATGKYNSSLGFDGTDDYIQLSSASSPNPTTGLTVSAWVKASNLANSTNYTIFAKQTWGSKLGFRFALGGYGGCANLNCLFIGVGDGVNQTETTSSGVNLANTDTWYHVVGTFSSGSLKLFVNGNLRYSTSTAVTSIVNDSTAARIGRHSTGSEYFPGQIDDVRTYNYALTEEQIKTLYNGGGALKFGP